MFDLSINTQDEEVKEKAAKLEYAEQCLTTLKLELQVSFLDLYSKGSCIMPVIYCCLMPLSLLDVLMRSQTHSFHAVHVLGCKYDIEWYLTENSFAGCSVQSGEL